MDRSEVETARTEEGRERRGGGIPSPDVDPHKMSLIKLLLFKPMQDLGMDEKGNPTDPFKHLFCDTASGKKRKAKLENPYDAFSNAW